MISNPLTPNPAAPPCRVLVSAGQPMTAGAQAILDAKRAVLQNSTISASVQPSGRFQLILLLSNVVAGLRTGLPHYTPRRGVSSAITESTRAGG